MEVYDATKDVIEVKQSSFIFETTLLLLCMFCLFLWKQSCDFPPPILNEDFRQLQKRYLMAYYCASFADWLHGPYLYKLYSDYGYDCGEISILYVAGFLSSSIFGVPVGYLADRYARKLVCACYGLLNTAACVTTIFPAFRVLLIGRIFGGVATAILFTTFESWYVNEHLNRYRFPPDWLNETFGKSGFINGCLAIGAGIVSHVLVSRLNLGATAPFLMSIPFLVLSTHLVLYTWDERISCYPSQNKAKFSTTLYLIFCKQPILLLLCFIQSLYESVVYIFIFSWSPIVSKLDPPLGIIFSTFMVSYMIGTKLYIWLASRCQRIPYILTATCLTGLLSFSVATLSLLTTLFDLPLTDRTKSTYALFFCFLFYQVSIGLYYPGIGYLRSRIVPEMYRVSVTNWFRVPMNTFTCAILVMQRYFCDNSGLKMAFNVNDDYRFTVTFSICTLMLVIATIMSHAFSNAYFLQVSDYDITPECRTASKECLTSALR